MPPAGSPENGVVTNTELPAGMPARIVLRYSRGNQTVRTRAAALKLRLQSEGLNVENLISSPANISSSSIMYFYNEDRNSADRVAEILAMDKSSKSPSQKNARRPIPGTIEVKVSD